MYSYCYLRVFLFWSEAERYMYLIDLPPPLCWTPSATTFSHLLSQ